MSKYEIVFIIFCVTIALIPWASVLGQLIAYWTVE